VVSFQDLPIVVKVIDIGARGVKGSLLMLSVTRGRVQLLFTHFTRCSAVSNVSYKRHRQLSLVRQKNNNTRTPHEHPTPIQ